MVIFLMLLGEFAFSYNNSFLFEKESYKGQLIVKKNFVVATMYVLIVMKPQEA
jgi:hypothetical protein